MSHTDYTKHRSPERALLVAESRFGMQRGVSREAGGNSAGCNNRKPSPHVHTPRRCPRRAWAPQGGRPGKDFVTVTETVTACETSWYALTLALHTHTAHARDAGCDDTTVGAADDGLYYIFGSKFKT